MKSGKKKLGYRVKIIDDDDDVVVVFVVVVGKIHYEGFLTVARTVVPFWNLNES